VEAVPSALAGRLAGQRGSDVAGDRLQNRADVGAEKLESTDRENGDEAEDKGVLDECLPFLVPLPQAAKQVDQHRKAHLLPSIGLALSLERGPLPRTGGKAGSRPPFGGDSPLFNSLRLGYAPAAPAGPGCSAPEA